ncbi:FAD-binding protein [Nocardioides sp. R1-1]|uniref:FAD-binding protein n=1 Tax=Nocardioides sp. R1-1 TaxID=3383502 RepID=UPI0038D1F0D4
MDWSGSRLAEEYDVVVAGSGAGGVIGAYTAAREGLSVCLVEAGDRFGGTTAYSGGGGAWFPANPVLQRAGTDDTVEDALVYFRAVVGERTPAELQEAYVRGGAHLISYLEQDEHFAFQPFPWPDYFGKAPRARGDGQRHIIPTPLPVAAAPELRTLVRGPLGTERRGTPPPDDLFVGGRALVARALTALATYDHATAVRETALVELVVEDGRVVGAVVEQAGERRVVRARRGMVLAAGGFEANEELRRRFGVPGSARDTMGPPTNTGLAHLAGMAVGADTDLMAEAWWSPGLTHPDGRSAFALWFTGGILVDQDGERFVNESAPYDRLGREVVGRLEAGEMALPFWMVYDDREGVVPPVRATNVPLAPTEEYVAAGLWHTADTLEELATTIGVPADRLVATVARFNELAARGVDEDFDRGAEPYDRFFADGGSPLMSIERGPFHAAAFGISDLGTKGGLRTDTAARVLDADGLPVPGLYAAGNTMAAPSGTTYPGGGNPIGASMLFAHLAVRDMVGRVS